MYKCYFKFIQNQYIYAMFVKFLICKTTERIPFMTNSNKSNGDYLKKRQHTKIIVNPMFSYIFCSLILLFVGFGFGKKALLASVFYVVH